MNGLAVVRLGKDSVPDIRNIDEHSGRLETALELTVACTQVPIEAENGTICLLWLGSDNSKGGETEWKKGLRAVGEITSKDGGPSYKDDWEVRVSVKYVFPESVTKKELLAYAAYAYYWCSEIPVLGINSYSNQTVQSIRHTEENQDVSALFYGLSKVVKDFYQDLRAVYPSLEPYLAYAPKLPDIVKEDIGKEKAAEIDSMVAEIEGNVLADEIEDLIRAGSSGIMLSGPPGTGKTWLAYRAALRITDKNPLCVRQIQFHPSYSYDDFIEGYVPTQSVETDGGSSPLFRVESKVFLLTCEEAINNPESTYVLVIDEFSRGDPSRIFGEILTYIEKEYRGVNFRLPYSGKDFSVPENIVVLGTMNPYDKSVSELDDAMERRFDKVLMRADINVLKSLVQAAGMPGELMGKLIPFFNAANAKTPHGIGHSYFKGVKNEADLVSLWNHKLFFLFEKMFRFQPATFREIVDAFKNILSPENAEKIHEL